MKAMTLLKGLGLGAGLMYFYDPQLGRRRRRLALDQLQHALGEMCASADVAFRDGRNRMQGCLAECSASLRAHDDSDGVVHDRVRSKLGRYVSHPSAVRVAVTGGHVVLSGPILSSEVELLVDRVKSVAGVRSVENRLDPHAAAGNVSALQGGRPRSGESPDILQQNWSPATRCLVGSLGGAMLLGAARNSGITALIQGVGAACFIAAAVQHTPRQAQPRPTGASHARRQAGAPHLAGSAAEEAREADLQARSGPT